MKEREFNLLDEKWILVMKDDGTIDKLSLIETLDCASEFRKLAGETPTQDVAVMRLLLAVLHTVVARYDWEGKDDPLKSPDQALARWKQLWNEGRFPIKAIRDYLNRYHDRFYLFDPNQPFFQSPISGRATEYRASKLNGELSESSNKVRLFPQRAGEEKTLLSYDEAARWLLHVNGFDDTSAKPTTSGKPSPGAGWMGKIGLTFAEGDNLFETLALNLILFKDGEDSLWDEEKPIWEVPVRKDERVQIALPNNLSELYTLMSRRLLLKRREDKVEGFLLLGGDFFLKENAFVEQMTGWRNSEKSEKKPPLYVPKRHNPARQLWRDFSSMVTQGQGERRPGVVNWIARLCWAGEIDRPKVRFQTVTTKYGDKDFFVEDIGSDSMTFSSGFLTDEGSWWIPAIVEALKLTDRLVIQLAYLAQCIAKAAGDPDGLDYRTAARESAYYRLDMPFREWLEGIDAEDDEIDDKTNEWWEISRAIVRRIGEEMIAQAGPQALVGRTLTENKKEIRYSAPEAYNRFLYVTTSRETLNSTNKGGNKNG